MSNAHVFEDNKVEYIAVARTDGSVEIFTVAAYYNSEVTLTISVEDLRELVSLIDDA